MRNVALVILLREAGFIEASAGVERARTAQAEREAIIVAAAMVEGALLMLHRHAKALRHTVAPYECGRLTGLHGYLTKRLGELLTKEARDASAH